MANNNSMDKVIERGDAFLKYNTVDELATLYGVPKQENKDKVEISGIIKNIIIPLIFIIGMIVYLKKGKNKVIKIIMISIFIIMLMMFISSLF